jgi:Beta-lactamase
VLSAPGAAPLLSNGWVWGTGASASAAIPVAGSPVPASMKPWVSAAEQVMEQNNLPGASLAVAFAGHEVLDVGLGYADLQTMAKVQPNSIFDIADLGRSITSAMIGMLINMHGTALAPAQPGTLLPGEVHSYGQQQNASGPTSPQEAPLQASEGADSWTSTASDLERFLIATAGTKPGAKLFTTWPDGDNGPYTPPVSQQVPVSQRGSRPRSPAT